MKTSGVLGVALALGILAVIGLDPIEAVAVPDAVVGITLGTLRPTMTTVNPGEQVTWLNVSGTPVARLLFDAVVGAPEATSFFTSSVTLAFSRPGVYPYTALVGGRAWPLRGTIAVK